MDSEGPPAAEIAFASSSVERPVFLLASLSLCRRELVRFLRQRHRVVGALLTPIVFWLLIGGGMGRSLQFAGMSGESYIRYFFPGTVVMILLFTAIFSTISIIEDRREGFLQGVLVSPAPRGAVVLGKVLGGTVLAAGQALGFLLLAPVVGFRFSIASFALSLLVMVILAFALTALGFCIAWRMTSTHGFHAIMNLFLMPMWFLSGALFPPEGAWTGMRFLMLANPLTYGLTGLRRSMLLAGDSPLHLYGPALWVCLLVTALFAAALFGLATWIARRDTAVNLH